MTKAYEFNWIRPVHEQLQNGSWFEIFFEEKTEIIFESCLFKVDEYGFFISWKPNNRESQILELCQVNDIRIGSLPKDNRIVQELQTRVQSKGNNIGLEDVLLTICCGTDMVNIEYTYCLCENADTAKLWQTGLRNITNNNKANNLCPSTCLKKHWMRLGSLVDAQGKIPVKSVAKTFASGKTEKLIYQYMKEVGLPYEKTDVIEPASWTFEKFYDLYYKICPRQDIEELFHSITQGKADFINTKQLIDFLNEKQRDPRLNEILYPLYDEKRAREIMRTYEPNAELAAQGRISRNGFTRYLMADENAPVFLDRLDIYMDMDQPLSHYYINSSHNTYLTGRQFGGRSSVEMYRQVLLAGCRCIELDCWDSTSKDEEIIITHVTDRKAMCSTVLFVDAIIAIRDTAFVTSEYPVILSFENHCSKKQQYKMAKYCDEILGDLLLKEPLPNFPLEPGVPLPSPNDLKRKIIIKNKKLRRDTEKVEYDLWIKGQLQSRADYEVKEDPNILVVENNSVISAASSSSPTQKTVPSSQPSNLLDPSTQSPSKSSTKQIAQLAPEQIALQNYHYIGATVYVHPWLSSMINYTQSVKFINFNESENANKHYHMSSFSETAALNLLKTQAIEFVNYNKRQLSRIFPKGLRTESSNFLPQIFWNAGCQMVALNFQTSDLPMQLNQGKFEYNGNCGYLLKPDFMRRKDRLFDPFAESPVDGVIAAQCSVRVISGQFLSDRKIGTYVECDMYGLPTDTIRKEFRTRMVPSNGLNPVYNEEPFVFRKVVLPDLAVLRIAVYDENSRMLGQRILPLDGLQAGYRHISLRTEGNFPMSLPMLFIHIELKIYVPDGLGDLMDALSDPRAFLSNQAEKRLQQMKQLGVEENDLMGNVLNVNNASTSFGAISSSNVNQQIQSSIETFSLQASTGIYLLTNAQEFEQTKFQDITIALLKEDKKYLKLCKKQKSKLNELHKNQQDEKQKTLKKQYQQLDKYLKQNNYNINTLTQTKLLKKKLTEQPNNSCSSSLNNFFSRPPSSQDESQASETNALSIDSITKDEQLEQIIQEHIKQWSILLDKQKKVELMLCKQQVTNQNEKLKKLMLKEQAKQVKMLSFLFAKHIKEMKEKQAKISVDMYKEVISDKTLRNNERDRKLREKKCLNTKKFIDERRSAAIIHTKEMDRLKKMHTNQLLELEKYSNNSIGKLNGSELEYKLFTKKKCFC